jgi:GNAT superfamily N-acetyltransferase
MDRDRVLEIQRSAFRDWIALLGSSSEGARVIELDRVLGAAAPVARTRSIANSVTYDDAAGLAGSYDELAAAYDDAGIEAWTVWVPEFDAEAIATLRSAGHAFDGKPVAMVLELARFEAPDLDGLDWDIEGDGALFATLNDLAYGYDPADGFGAALSAPPGAIHMRLYRARVDGEPVCVLGTIDNRGVASDPDCGIYCVATHPGYRGRGLATRLLAAALVEARDRGCVTSSLQASPAGEPVYAALGYERSFRFHLYERRDQDPGVA